MKVLVTAASKHGATAEIAGEIGETLRDALRKTGDEEVTVDVRTPEGDFRDKEAIGEWARGIAAELAAS